MQILTVSARRSWLYVGSIVFLLALGSCAEEEKPPEVIRAIKWMQVVGSDTTQLRKISGVVKPVNETKVSFEVSGRVDDVKVRLGDRIKKDDVLAVLDPLPFQLEEKKARSEKKAAEAVVKEKKAGFERIRALYESNNASKAEYDSARADYDSARSRRKAAKAQLGLAQRDLRLTTLRAPFDGIISVKSIEPHEEIRAGQTLFQLDGEDAFEVAAAVPEQVVIKLRTGEAAAVVFPTLNNRRVSGVITEIGTKAVTANTFPVTVELQEQFSELRAGMSVEVEFAFPAVRPTGETVGRGFTVPMAAILAGADKQHFVFIFERAAGVVHKTPVEVLEIRDNDIILESGIKAGDIIATAGVEFLADKQKVKLMGP